MISFILFFTYFVSAGLFCVVVLYDDVCFDLFFGIKSFYLYIRLVFMLSDLLLFCLKVDRFVSSKCLMFVLNNIDIVITVELKLE